MIEALCKIANSDTYPYILTTGRDLEHYNCGSMTRRTKNIEIHDQDILLVHPNDATTQKISDGDFVKLKSAKGEVRIRAKISDSVNPGVLYTTFHFPELDINSLTSDVSDIEAMTPEYKVVAVQLERSVL